MRNCKICGKEKSPFHMNNKLVCLKCDELLFDVEIECDENEVVKDPRSKTPAEPPRLRTVAKPTQK